MQVLAVFIEPEIASPKTHAAAAMPVPTIARISAYSRSEEHTSELQSLMRISYAVFCLKKKKQSEYLKVHIMSSNTSHTYTRNHQAVRSHTHTVKLHQSQILNTSM